MNKTTATQWARNVLANESAIIIDTETTGLGDSDQIVQIAIINTQGHEIYNTLIRPTVPIHPATQSIHKITTAAIASAPILLGDCLATLALIRKMAQ